MRFLSGMPHGPVLTWEHGGLMLTPEMGNKRQPMDGVVWAADNGCYTAGARFSVERWLAFLRYWQPYARACLFAVLPDVPFDHHATLARSLPYVEAVRALGYIPALAIQEGATPENIPWDSGIGALFVAGGKPRPQPTPLWADIQLPPAPATRDWKTCPTVQAICREGKRRGFFVHSARNNSKHAMQDAYTLLQADSIDGTFLKYAPDYNWTRLQRWFDEFCPHAELALCWGNDTRFWRCAACGVEVWRAEERISA